MSSLSFWKPGTTAPGSSLDRLTQEQESVIPSAPSDNSLSLQAQRERLPIAKYRRCPHVFFFEISQELAAFRGQALILHRAVSSHYCSRANWLRKNYTYVAHSNRSHQLDSLKNFLNICWRLDGLLKVM
jgi:hypothetical protein